MHGLTTEVIAIYSIAWLVAFCASISRSARDADAGGIVRILGLGSASGFFAVGVIGVGLSNWIDASGDGAVIVVGSSALIGLLGKEQDAYVKLMVSKLMNTAKVLGKDDKQ